jgi:uncharacterized membrane protein YdjX (TVP38/TMEM64 family)
MNDAAAEPSVGLSISNNARTVDPPEQSTFRKLGPVGFLAMLVLIAPPITGIFLFAAAPKFAPWLQSHGLLAAFLYVAALAFLSGLALLPTYAPAVLAGWAFGVALGVPVMLTGLFFALIIAWFIGQRASGDRVTRILDAQPKRRAIYRALVRSTPRRTFLITALLRLPPNAPFALVNLILSSVRIPLKIFVPASLLGLVPRTTAAIYIGSHLSTLDFSRPDSLWYVAFIIAATMLVVTVIGLIARQALSRITTTP